jgi:hypothetical protein
MYICLHDNMFSNLFMTETIDFYFSNFCTLPVIHSWSYDLRWPFTQRHYTADHASILYTYHHFNWQKNHCSQELFKSHSKTRQCAKIREIKINCLSHKKIFFFKRIMSLSKRSPKVIWIHVGCISSYRQEIMFEMWSYCLVYHVFDLVIFFVQIFFTRSTNVH